MGPSSFGDHRDLALQSISDYGRQLVRALEGVQEEEARWMPSPESNHILWILWHMGRMEDLWGWYLRSGSGDSAWEEGGWAARLGIDVERNGMGDSPEQVRDFPDVSIEQVTAYWQAARDLLTPAIEKITPHMLSDTHPGLWRHAPDRAPTLLWVLGRIPVENSQHTGQIAYIRGLYAAQGMS